MLPATAYVDNKIHMQKSKKYKFSEFWLSWPLNILELIKVLKDREAWHAAVHDVTKCRTRLRDWTTTKVIHNRCNSTSSLSKTANTSANCWGLSMVLTDTWQGAVETSVLIKYICLKDFMAVYGWLQILCYSSSWELGSVTLYLELCLVYFDPQGAVSLMIQ